MTLTVTDPCCRAGGSAHGAECQGVCGI